MTPKQQAIKEAYGEYYNPEYIDENGWTYNASKDLVKSIPCDFKQMQVVYGLLSDWVRPISLRGIENNRGWVSVKERLPDELYLIVWLYNSDGETYIHSWTDNAYCKKVTHWQPVVKPEPPLY